MEVLSFGGDVLVFHGGGSGVSVRRLSFDRDSRHFCVRGDDTHVTHTDGETHIVRCASALDERQRRRVPCVLLQLNGKRFKYTLYSVCSSAEARLHVELALSYEMTDHVSILTGPTLLWSHEGIVFYASSRTGGVKRVPIPITVTFIGELPLRERKLVVQGTRSDSSDGKSVLCFVGGEEEACDAACLFPHAYGSVIRCATVLSAEERGGSFASEVLAATCRKQLVGFENGLPRDVCALPYEHPEKIQTLHTLRNDCLVVVSFAQGNVCAVWKHSFQVATCWTGVRLLLVDDFLGCGTDQMLLVFGDQDSSAETLSNFLLTDLCGITFSGGGSGEVLNSSDAAQENFLLTARALQSRWQSGLNFLDDLQRDMEVKDRLILQSLRALTDLVSGREHVIFPPEQEGLVSLWDEDDDDAGDEERGVSDDGMQTECAEALLKVDGVWQRVIGQSLIVGVVLSPTDHTSVMEISASVVVDPRQTAAAPVMNAQIRPFPVSDASVAHGPPAEKKIRRSDRCGSRLALVAVTDAAPLLTSGSATYPIMLHYSSRESSGSSRASQYCGRISVSLRDVSTGKFLPRLLQDRKLNTDEAREDLLSLDAVLSVWLFRVWCSDHTLVDVQGWLEESLRVERLEVDPRFTSDPSDLRLFRWEQMSPFQAVLSVQCRDDLHLLHFLHSLCDFLPASHHVQLLEAPGPRGAAPGLARALETEMLAVMQDVLRCGEEQTAGPEESDASSEPLQRLREEWQRERGRFQKRLRPLVDGSAYSSLVERMIDRQTDADELALMEASRL